MKGMNATQPQYRPMSRHMFGALRFFDTHEVRQSHLNQYRDTTLYTLLSIRRYVASDGIGDDPLIVLTREGEEALRLYEQASIPERDHEAELTERTSRILRLVRSRNARHAA